MKLPETCGRLSVSLYTCDNMAIFSKVKRIGKQNFAVNKTKIYNKHEKVV